MSYTFDKRSIERIARQVRENERRVRSNTAIQRKWETPQDSAQLIQIDTAIPAATGTAPGKQQCRLVSISDTDTFVFSDELVDVYNSQALATTTGIAQAKYIGGRLFVDVCQCPV